MKPAFVTTRLCRAPASHIASDNAIMCDMLTHCKVYAGLQMRRATSLSHAVLLPVYALFVTIMLRTRTQPALAFQHQQATLTFNRLSIRSALALLFVPHVETCFKLPRLQTAGHQTVSTYELHQNTTRAYHIVIIPR